MLEARNRCGAKSAGPAARLSKLKPPSNLNLLDGGIWTVTLPFCASVSLSVQWAWLCLPHRVVVSIHFEHQNVSLE